MNELSERIRRLQRDHRARFGEAPSTLLLSVDDTSTLEGAKLSHVGSSVLATLVVDGAEALPRLWGMDLVVNARSTSVA